MRQKLGQHYLTDPLVIQAIVQSVTQITNADPWFEIGPGKGAITIPLIRQLGALDLIELDDKLVANWQLYFEKQEAVRVFHEDVLLFDFDAKAQSKGHQSYNIVSNLPYQIATPLLDKLLRTNTWRSMIIMVQREVADRLLAKTGTKQWGVLSILCQLTCNAYRILDVEPQAFLPPPRVHSTVIRLDNIHHKDYSANAYSRDDIEKMMAVAKKIFENRRKTLKFDTIDNFAQLLAKLNISPTSRGESLSISQLHKLALAIHNHDNQ